MTPLAGWSAAAGRAEPMARLAGARYTERPDDLAPPPEDLLESGPASSEVSAEGGDPGGEFASAARVAAPRAAAVEPEAAARLPSVEELVERIPQPVREALEELFRARFTSVRRLPPPTEPAPVVP